MQVWVSLENEGDPHYDSHKEFWEPCREEWVETPTFIFKDSCSRGVGIKSMQGLYLFSSLLFVHAEKTPLCSLLHTSIVAEIIFRGTEHRDDKMAGRHARIHTQIGAQMLEKIHTRSSRQCCMKTILRMTGGAERRKGKADE